MYIAPPQEIIRRHCQLNYSNIAQLKVQLFCFTSSSSFVSFHKSYTIGLPLSAKFPGAKYSSILMNFANNQYRDEVYQTGRKEAA